MVISNLRQLLADAMPPHAPPATLTDFDLQNLLQEADGGRITPDVSVTALLDCLRKDPELAMFRGRTQVVRDVGKGLTHVFLAEWLLRRAGTVGANQAVTDLERYLRTERLPYHSIVAIGGISVDRGYDLGNGLQLVLWKDVVDSRTKRSIDEADSFHRSFYHPDCALLREVELPRVHVDYTETRKHIGSRDVTTETDLLLCLGIVGPTAPVLLASWLEPPEWAPMIRGSMSMPFVEGPGKARPFPESAAVDGSRLFSNWLGLPEERRMELRVPMQRLNSAMRRASLVDAAIDLGIALESIFLPDSRGGLTFRLRVRVARWLGSTPEERRRLSHTVGDLYTVRSKAVHEGRVPDTIHQRETRELLEEGYELTARALMALISKGAPDWDAVIYG